MRNLLRVVMVLALALLASALYYRSRPPVIPSADETAVFEVMLAEMNPPKMSGVVPPECMAREEWVWYDPLACGVKEDRYAKYCVVPKGQDRVCVFRTLESCVSASHSERWRHLDAEWCRPKELKG